MLQRRVLCDMQQSEIIVKILTDKYIASNVTEEPEKEKSEIFTCSVDSRSTQCKFLECLYIETIFMYPIQLL